jgi:hypothetical protein
MSTISIIVGAALIVASAIGFALRLRYPGDL